MTGKTTKQSLNEVLTVLSLLKLFFFMRTFVYFTRFNDPRAQRVCQMNGCKATTLFAVKSIVQESPYTLISIMFVLTAFSAAYALQVFERPLRQAQAMEDPTKTDSLELDSYWNSLWLTVVTMTTVGYGDLYPKTIGGRLIGMIVCIWGIFITSFFTVTLTNFLTFTPSQNKAFLLLQRLFWKELL